MRLNWRKNCNKIHDLSWLISLSLFLMLLFLFPILSYAQSSVLDLNTAIQDKKRAQRELQEKMAQYRQQIQTTQRKAASLTNQINILESNILKTGLEIQTKELEAEQLALEVQVVENQIRQEEDRMANTRLNIANTLREVAKFDNRKYVEILLAEDSFSEVFDQLFYSERLAYNLKQKLDTIQSIQGILTNNHQLLTDKRTEIDAKKSGLNILRGSFEQERRVKETLFGKTKATESDFRELLEELRAAAASIDSEIVTLERTVREKLEISDKLAGDTGLLSWPVPPIGGISARFHDPEYPFRYLFEHGGIDIRTPQGTPIRAAASGYVAKAFNGGLGIRPSYVMLVHGNSLATVYMHVSSITVTPGTYVARGDIIAYSGGTPRTPGAGRWTTGPHLHFETRINGVPVDPTGYLP